MKVSITTKTYNMNHKLTMKTLLLCLIAMVATQAHAQGWMKKYSPDFHMGSNALYNTADGNLLTTGWNLYTTGQRYMKIGTDGNPMWQVTHDSTSGISFSNTTQDRGLISITFNTDASRRYLIRTDANGQRLWVKDAHFAMSGSTYGNADIDTTNDGGFVVVHSAYDSVAQISKMYIRKVDTNGDEVWTRSYFDIDTNKYVQSIRNSKDGGYICVIAKGNSIDLTYSLFKIDDNGNLLWEYIFPYQKYVTPTLARDGNILLTMGSVLHTAENSLIKIDQSGNQLWTVNYPMMPDSSTWQGYVQEKADGSLALMSGRFSSTTDRFSFCIIDTLGNLLYQKKLPTGNLGYNVTLLSSSYRTFIRTTDGGYAVSGFINNDPQGYSAFIIKMDSMGNVYPSLLKGNTYADANENCIKEAGEAFICPVNVTFSSANDTFTVITRDSGYYVLGVNNENYSISVTPPSPYWEASSCNAANVNLPAGTLDSTLQLGLKPVIYSPFITINGEIDRQRACMPATYTAQYCNTGTAPFAGIILLEIDTLLTVDSASTQIFPAGIGKWVCVVPQLNAMECGTLKVYCTVSCDPQYMGHTVCVNAHAEQDTVVIVPQGWDESNLHMSVVQTNTDTITFTLKNIGNGDMANPKGLIVIEDNVILINTPISLPAGAEHIVTVPANGSTWRATIPQTDFNPYSSFATAAIEGAGTNQQGGVSLGFYLQYPNNGYYGYNYQACGEIRNSYDPNEKVVMPKGMGPDHLVDSTVDLEYTLYFQNTGNDTAYLVRITDTLESYLNPATLVAGASSHPYTVELLGNNVLQFTFVRINLPDSATNEAGSNGFVKFRIKQKAGNTTGTVINNKVNIFFDFNPPIVTNTATVRIGKVLVTGIENVYTEKEITINAYPNPFVNSTRIEVQGETFNSLQLNVYDLSGRVVSTQNANNTNGFTVQKADLTNGTYIFEISSQGRPVAKGKLIAQ